MDDTRQINKTGKTIRGARIDHWEAGFYSAAGSARRERRDAKRAAKRARRREGRRAIREALS